MHLLADELAAASQRRTWIDRMRYRPAQWGTRGRWQEHRPDDGEAWFGFAHVRPIVDAGVDVLLVPLIGHTLGHAGVAIRRESDWLFYAADAFSIMPR